MDEIGRYEWLHTNEYKGILFRTVGIVLWNKSLIWGKGWQDVPQGEVSKADWHGIS